LPQFHFEKFVNSPREKVFRIFTDYENYQNLFPNSFPSVRILSTRDNTSIVEEHMMLGNKELVMMTKHVTEEPDLHEIFVIGGDAKGSHVVEKFEELSNGTVIKIDVNLKMKGVMKISGLFGKSRVENDYLKIISEYVKMAEDLV